MKADPILLQMKYARVVRRFAERCCITLGEALDFFYHSDEYTLVTQTSQFLNYLTHCFI